MLKILLVFFTIMACKDSSFEGGSGKKKAATPNPEASNPANSNAQDSVPRVPASNPSTGTPSATQNPAFVDKDGIEAYDSCDDCLSRARALAQGQGVTLNTNFICNLGSYKVSIASNLCDYHFFLNASQRIEDHRPSDSVLNNQFVLYCNCNCNGLPSFEMTRQNCAHRKNPFPGGGDPRGFFLHPGGE